MKRFLHFSLLSMFLVLCNGVMAQTQVTIDFDNDYKTLFPTLSGVSSNDSQDGDFTGITNSTEVDGVYVIVAPAEDAKTPSRIWTSAPRLRMYSGTFTVVGEGITKIEFTGHNTNFYLTPDTGTLDGKTWTGNADEVVFTVAKNTQINKIEVTMGDEDDDDDGLEFVSGTISETDNQLVFDFTAIDCSNGADVTGQMIVDFENGLCTTTTMTVTYPTEELAKDGYEWIMADEDGIYESVEQDGCVVKVVSSQFNGYTKEMVKTMLAMLIDDENSGDGTLENPLSAVEANTLVALVLEPGETTDENYFIKGKVSSIKFTFSAQYGTATFFISDDGTANNEFQCYSVYYLENKPWVEGYTQIKVGDDVIVCGKLTNYNGTPETASKQAFIYSLNGQTEAENIDNPEPEVQLITVAKALEIIDALENGKTTAETYQVKGFVTSITEISTQYGNATFVMADDQGDQTGLTVYRAKGFDNEKITDDQLFKVGDLVVVEGKLQKYVKNDVVTPEVSGGYFVSINGATAIASAQAEQTSGPVYTLSGQLVEHPTKGIYIQNGRKIVVK